MPEILVPLPAEGINPDLLAEELASVLRDGYMWGVDDTGVRLLVNDAVDADSLREVVRNHRGNRKTQRQQEREQDTQEVQTFISEVNVLLAALQHTAPLDAIIDATGAPARGEVRDLAREMKETRRLLARTLRLLRAQVRG